MDRSQKRSSCEISMQKHFLPIRTVSHILPVRRVKKQGAVKQGLMLSVKCLEITLPRGKMNSYNTKLPLKFKILRKSVIWEKIKIFYNYFQILGRITLPSFKEDPSQLKLNVKKQQKNQSMVTHSL